MGLTLNGVDLDDADWTITTLAVEGTHVHLRGTISPGASEGFLAAIGWPDSIGGYTVASDGETNFTVSGLTPAVSGSLDPEDPQWIALHLCPPSSGTPVAPDEWYVGTEPVGDNPSALVDGDPDTYGKEDYPSGFAVMYYATPFSATGMVMEQMPGETSLGIGGFGKNAAAAWHLEAWPDALGAPPAPATDGWPPAR